MRLGSPPPDSGSNGSWNQWKRDLREVDYGVRVPAFNCSGKSVDHDMAGINELHGLHLAERTRGTWAGGSA